MVRRSVALMKRLAVLAALLIHVGEVRKRGNSAMDVRRLLSCLLGPMQRRLVRRGRPETNAALPGGSAVESSGAEGLPKIPEGERWRVSAGETRWVPVSRVLHVAEPAVQDRQTAVPGSGGSVGLLQRHRRTSET
eukprot:scaffold1231_cov187-Pinguiococcus_pyrenoidosus.AAC.25